MNVELFFLTIFEKKVIMKILGYFLKGISVVLLIISSMSIVTAITGIIKNSKEDSAFLVGYIIGSIIGLSLFFWGSISLLKYSNRLISKSKSKNEIATIGKE